MGVFHNNDIPLPKFTEIQFAFSRVLECVVMKLTLCFPDQIHSLYVYMNLSRMEGVIKSVNMLKRTATFEKSDYVLPAI